MPGGRPDVDKGAMYVKSMLGYSTSKCSAQCGSLLGGKATQSQVLKTHVTPCKKAAMSKVAYHRMLGDGGRGETR